MFKKLGLGCLGLLGALMLLGVLGAAFGGGSRGGEAILVGRAVPVGENRRMTAVPVVAARPTESVTAPTDAPVPAATVPQVYRVSDVVQLGDVALAVVGWSRPEGTQFARPGAGKRFVGVELLVVNQGERAANLSTLAQMSLKDAEGRRYTVDLLAATALGGAAPEGELAPGERLRGSVGFQAPAEAEGLTFVFDASLFRSGKVFIELGPEPRAVELPAALSGEAAPRAHAVGEPIAVGELGLTVHGVSSPEGTQFAKPAEGNRFVVVELSIANNGDEAANLSTLLQMKLKDAGGRQYAPDLLAATAADGAAPEGELAPGETVRGPVGFQVPAKAEGLAFVFDGDIFGAGKVFVRLP
jgi:hypothetical protein